MCPRPPHGHSRAQGPSACSRYGRSVTLSGQRLGKPRQGNTLAGTGFSYASCGGSTNCFRFSHATDERHCQSPSRPRRSRRESSHGSAARLSFRATAAVENGYAGSLLRVAGSLRRRGCERLVQGAAQSLLVARFHVIGARSTKLAAIHIMTGIGARQSERSLMREGSKVLRSHRLYRFRHGVEQSRVQPRALPIQRNCYPMGRR